LDRHGSPEIFNSDQGVQFTSAAFTGVPGGQRVYASAWMAKAVTLDNIFIERLWRSLKYEDIYTKAYASVPEAAPWHRRLAGILQTMSACISRWVIGPHAKCSRHRR